MSHVQAPGWYGKLPALGDFASRHLAAPFIEAWDRWLAAGLERWREADETWLDAFLAAPVCHFALGAGVPYARSPGWAGVLMPSCDRVGRYFPLTIVRERGAAEFLVPANWLRGAEGCAVGALQEDWDAARLDHELTRLDGDPDPDGADWPDPGQARWWCERDGIACPPLITGGLPDGDDFVRLLGGRL